MHATGQLTCMLSEAFYPCNRSGLRFPLGTGFPPRYPGGIQGGPTQRPLAGAGHRAAGAAGDSPKEEPSCNPARHQGIGCLGLWSYLAWAVCWAAVLLVMVACMALGSGTVGTWPVSI